MSGAKRVQDADVGARYLERFDRTWEQDAGHAQLAAALYLARDHACRRQLNEVRVSHGGRRVKLRPVPQWALDAMNRERPFLQSIALLSPSQYCTT